MALQESGEMYLESILLLTQKNGHVRSIDISEHMGYSKPSVSRAVGLLKKGKENCTQGPKPQEQLVMKDMFIEEHVEEKPKVEEQQTKVVEEEVKKEEQPNKENKEKDKPTKKHKQTDNGPSIWGSWFKPFDSLSEKMKKATKEFIDNTTQEEDDSDDEHNAL